GVGYQYSFRSCDHSWPASFDSPDVRIKSLVLAERALPSHMAKFPRRSCRPTAYWPVTLDCAAPAVGLFPSASAWKIVSEGLLTLVSLVCAAPLARDDRLTQSLPFSPYIKKACAKLGAVIGVGCVGQE